MTNNTMARMCRYNLYAGTRMISGGGEPGYEMVAAFYILLDMLSVNYLNMRGRAMRLEEAFNKNYNRFTENEQYICRYLLEHKKECAVMSITEFAGSCHVSESMLVRFAKKNSLAGYGELKARLRLEEQETEEAMGPGEGLLNTVTDSYHKMMDELIGRGLDSLFEKLYRARRVFLYGSGSAQTRAASEMKRIFLPVKEMFHIHGHDMRAHCPG